MGNRVRLYLRAAKAVRHHEHAAAQLWCEIGNGIMFKRCQDEEEKGEKGSVTVTTTTLNLKCAGRNAGQRIDEFIEKAFNWYVQKVQSEEDTSRYMYIPNTLGSAAAGDDSEARPPAFKRYKLSGEKTFKSMFFPEKETLLRLIEQFVKRDGKFSVAGFPHKLGLLLHGPPGTGKTSLIKALAAHTERNVISVPLGRIKTNQELLDLFFDQSFDVGEELPVKLSFAQTIFVLEDIDAATKVVLRRDKPTSSTTTKITVAKEQHGGKGTPKAGANVPPRLTLTRTVTDGGSPMLADEDDQKEEKEVVVKEAPSEPSTADETSGDGHQR